MDENTAVSRILPKSLSYLRPHKVNDLTRLGNPGDGGYVVPSSILGGIDCVITFGLGQDLSFEEDLMKRRKGIPFHIYDHSVLVRPPGCRVGQRTPASSIAKILHEKSFGKVSFFKKISIIFPS